MAKVLAGRQAVPLEEGVLPNVHRTRDTATATD